MLVDLEWLCGVVARHCPTFFLHPADKYMPCSAEFFLENSELRQRDSRGAVTVLLPRGAVAGPLLLEAQERAPPGSRLWLELDPAARVGMPKDDLGAVPVYAHSKAVVAADGSVEALEITFITLYAYNGPYRVGGAPFLTTGAHDGDIEHLTVRCHPTTGALVGVWFNAHRSRDGCWVAGPQVPRAADGSIAAYTALHGHGVYPLAGRIPRHFFLGNDLTSSRGPIWRPRSVVLLPPLNPDRGAEEVPADGDAQLSSSVSLDSVPAEEAHSGEGGSILEASLGALQLDGQQPQQEQQPQQPQQLATAPTGQQQPRSRHRKLPVVPSRGSYLSSLDATPCSSVDPAPNASPSNGAAAVAAAAAGSLPMVDAQQESKWLWFSGDWGGDGPPGPAFQGWYHMAECPVSRSPLLRVVGHLFKEVERV